MEGSTNTVIKVISCDQFEIDLDMVAATDSPGTRALRSVCTL